MLSADPLAQCLPLVVEARPAAAPTTATPATPAPAANAPGAAGAVTPAPIAAGSRAGFPGLPCRTPLPSGPRYVSASINLPYEPPFAATELGAAADLRDRQYIHFDDDGRIYERIHDGHYGDGRI